MLIVGNHHLLTYAEFQSMEGNICCKLFFVQMFSPIYATNGITVPCDSLRKVVIP